MIRLAVGTKPPVSSSKPRNTQNTRNKLPFAAGINRETQRHRAVAPHSVYSVYSVVSSSSGLRVSEPLGLCVEDGAASQRFRMLRVFRGFSPVKSVHFCFFENFKETS